MATVRRKPAPRVARVLLRLPVDLHRALARMAKAEALSFNELCVRRLRAPSHPQDTSAVRSLVIDRARAVFGNDLAGIVLLGSWARGDASVQSDIDTLVVISPRIPITRDLYRQWDEVPLTFEGRVIDAHFAHAQDAGAPPGAVWCEAAVDGLVWYDRDGRVTSRLAEVRRAIADGRVVRASAHGQPYWKGAA